MGGNHAKTEEADSEDELRSGSENDGEEDEGNQEELQQLAEAKPKRSPSASPAPRRDVLLDLLNDHSIDNRDSDALVATSGFDTLPREIKHVLLSFLDYDPHSVLCLSLVSRTWYKALNQGRSTDIDWQRRCGTMGIQRRSPRCNNWRETFIRQLQKRCLICFQPSKTAYGHLLDGRPDWLKVCETCQMLPGPFQTISFNEAARRCTNEGGRQLLRSNLLVTLPFLAVKIRNRDPKVDKKYGKFLLASAIPGDPWDGYFFRFSDCNESRLRHLQHKAADLAAEMRLQESDLVRLFKCAQHCLAGTCFPSARLLHMVAAIDHWELRKMSLRDILQEAIAYVDGVMALIERVNRQKLSEPDPKKLQRKPRLKRHTAIKPFFGRSWGDAILTGTVEIEDYIAALRSHPGRQKQQRKHKPQREAKAKAVDAIRSELAVTPAQDESDASEDGRSAVPKCPCGRPTPGKCAHARCKTCCPGPCGKHKKGDRIDLRATKKEEDGENGFQMKEHVQPPPRVNVQCVCGKPAAVKCVGTRCRGCCSGPCPKHKRE